MPARPAICPHCGQPVEPDDAQRPTVPCRISIPPAASITVGRAADNDVVITDAAVSRYHLRIDRDGDRLSVHDLASANGTRVNGRQVSLAVLRDGDSLDAGATTFRIQGRDLLWPSNPMVTLRAARKLVDTPKGQPGGPPPGRIGPEPSTTRRLPIPPGGSITCGRSSDNDLVISSDLVSRHHFRVDARGDLLTIHDLESANGIRLNGHKVTTAGLEDGDTLRVGPASFVIQGRQLTWPANAPVEKGRRATRAGVPAGLNPAGARLPSSNPPLLGSLLRIGSAVAVAGLLIAMVIYTSAAAELPDPATLRQKLATFRSTLFYDRNGQIIGEAFDPDAGRRTVIPLDQIASDLRDATVATEDANFFRHSGVDATAILRALWYAFRGGSFVSGGSTIPQQLVKLAFLSPERTLRRKVKEAILAMEISRRYSKDEILELYLNEVFYGNHAYGIESAAQTYFDKSAADLSLAESALLAGLPQAPALHDPLAHPDRAAHRQHIVLGLMVKHGYIDQAQADAAVAEQLSYSRSRAAQTAPHFTLWVREQIEAIFGPEALYRQGLSVTTTLDSRMQALAERTVRQGIDALAEQNVGNGALVALRPGTGEVLALVGSKDFTDDAIAGQINMAAAPRQPGSSLKPFVYLRAFMDPQLRWTPGTLVPDIATVFEDGVHAPYEPTNYDGREHGLVTVRDALANSYNIPAVRALEAVGIADFLQLARVLGLTALERDDYGLPLALGAAEVPLTQLTAAYGVLAGGGQSHAPITVLRVTDASGAVLCELGGAKTCDSGAGPMTTDTTAAFLVTEILADNTARGPAFGLDSPLVLDRPAAAKTGTTNDYRDNWTVGYTPQLVTGVWVGNADRSVMLNSSGITGAAPIWHDFMMGALANEPVESFSPPANARQSTICSETGTLPDPACPATRLAWFAIANPPAPAKDDLFRLVALDTRTGLLASAGTPPEAIEQRPFKVYPDAYRQWAETHGIPQPPSTSSPLAPPVALITAPTDGEVVSGDVPVMGTAADDGFSTYSLAFGAGAAPTAFAMVDGSPSGNTVTGDVLGIWPTDPLAPGEYVLRLTVETNDGRTAEQSVRVVVGGGPVTWTPTTPITATLTATTAPTITPSPAPPQAPSFWQRLFGGP